MITLSSCIINISTLGSLTKISASLTDKESCDIRRENLAKIFP